MMCRKSSIVPGSILEFDHYKYFCKNDVSVTDFGLVVNLKYAKQINAEIAVIELSATHETNFIDWIHWLHEKNKNTG